MNFNTEKGNIILALFGCLFIIVSFWITAKLKIINQLNLNVPKSEIISRAEQAYDNSDFAFYDLNKKLNLSINNNLLHYAQLHLKELSSEDFLPIGKWNFSWRGKIESKKEGAQEIYYNLTYDFNGNLVGMEQNSPDFNKPPNFKESEALAAAKNFLYSLKIDTSALSLRNNIINKDDRVLNYDFAFSKPSSVSSDLKEYYNLKISGRNITSYQAKTIIDHDRFNFPEIDRNSEIVAIILMIVVWVLISIFLIVMFFQRLKHDELEFRRAIWLGITAFLMLWIAMAIQSWPDWQEVLLAGGFASVFTGIAIVFIYSVTDSLTREIWQEKVDLTDVLFRGFFRVKEFGASLLNALFISGVTLSIFAVIFRLTTELNLGFLSFDEDVLFIFKGNSALLANVIQTIISSLFIGLVLYSFWISYLRSKIQNNIVLVILLGIFINLAGLELYILRPTYLSFLLLLPLAILWAYFVYKYDFISILISLFIVNLFIELILMNLMPNGWLSIPGALAGIFILLLFILGSYFVFSRVSVKDFEHYVPEYVSRIAEREKFLKELEIARSVQMRFLPQSVPSFPPLDIASICRPAREVGGDYYDFILNGDNSLGIIIGDVSGKGVSAAFYMTMVKGIIKTLTKSTMTPKKMLTEMNAIFYENAPKNIFISMIYGLFDIQNKTLTFARAGHNPIIFRKSKAENPEMLYSKGLAIGLEKGKLFPSIIEEVSLPVEPGDVFVFFTDGISESMDINGDEFGEERLLQTISRYANFTSQELLNKITHEVYNFAGQATQHDDFTMVVVKMNG